MKTTLILAFEVNSATTHTHITTYLLHCFSIVSLLCSHSVNYFSDERIFNCYSNQLGNLMSLSLWTSEVDQMPIRSDVDQILLSKFTSTTSDSRISDQLLMSKGTGSMIDIQLNVMCLSDCIFLAYGKNFTTHIIHPS